MLFRRSAWGLHGILLAGRVPHCEATLANGARGVCAKRGASLKCIGTGRTPRDDSPARGQCRLAAMGARQAGLLCPGAARIGSISKRRCAKAVRMDLARGRAHARAPCVRGGGLGKRSQGRLRG